MQDIYESFTIMRVSPRTDTTKRRIRKSFSHVLASFLPWVALQEERYNKAMQVQLIL